MSINLNNTTPAAPTGSTNISFQRDVSGNVSAYITSSAELVGDNVDTAAQTANIATTSLEAAPIASMYRASVYIVITQAATTSSTLPSVGITWKDLDSAVTQTVQVTATSTANVLGTIAQASFVFNSFAATTISYSTTGYVSVGATPMAYKVHIRLERI